VESQSIIIGMQISHSLHIINSKRIPMPLCEASSWYSLFVNNRIMEIELTQGRVAIVDKEDYELVNKYKWHYRKSGRTNGKNGYAQHSLSRDKSLFMHNLIMKPKGDVVVDHINHDGLDNRRENLRVVTKSQNAHNVVRKNKSGYRGVSYFERLKNTKPYEARIRVDNKLLSLGTYKTAIEAAKVYNERAKEEFGDCAILNKI